MPSSGVMGRWTESPEVWFGLGFQIKKNWTEIMNRMAHITKTWFWRSLSLKGMADVANVFITLVITYRLTAVPWPGS